MALIRCATSGAPFMPSIFESSRIAVSHFSVDAVSARPTSETNFSAVEGSIAGPRLAISANRRSTSASARLCRCSVLSLFPSSCCGSNGSGETSRRRPRGALPSAFSKARKGNEQPFESKLISEPLRASFNLLRNGQSTRQKIVSRRSQGREDRAHSAASSSSNEIT